MPPPAPATTPVPRRHHASALAAALALEPPNGAPVRRWRGPSPRVFR